MVIILLEIEKKNSLCQMLDRQRFDSHYQVHEKVLTHI
jgi:hypothetical protein